jgi:hypothetical protein
MFEGDVGRRGEEEKSAGPAGAFNGCGLSVCRTKETGPAEREDEMPDITLVR